MFLTDSFLAEIPYTHNTLTDTQTNIYIHKYIYIYICTGKGNGNPLQYSCLAIPWTEEPGRPQSMGS